MTDKAISRTFQGRFASLTKLNYKDYVLQLKLCGEIQIQTGMYEICFCWPTI